MPHAVPITTKPRTHAVVKGHRLSEGIPQHILDCLPDPADVPPPALADRSAWIRSLEPWRRDKLRPHQYDVYSVSSTSDDSSVRSVSDVTDPRSAHYDVSSTPSDDVRPDPSTAWNDGTIVCSSMGSPYVVPQKGDRLLSGRPGTGLAVRLTRQALIAHTNNTSATMRRRLSDCGSSASLVRPPVPRRDSAAAILAPARIVVAQHYAPLSARAYDSGRDADDEGCSSLGLSSLTGPTNFGDSINRAPPNLHSVTYPASVGNSNSRPSLHDLQSATRPTSVSEACMDRYQQVAGNAAFEPMTVSSDRDCVARDSVAGSVKPSLGPVNVSANADVVTVQRPLGAATEYKKMAGPLSEWVAHYLWRVVTTRPDGFAARAPYSLKKPYFPAQPPAYLADAIKGCLLATLLQPSAVFLSLWYIARLPVYLGDAAFDADSPEAHFRRVLLGEGVVPLGSEEKLNLEHYAPLKVLVNAFSLASKLLDDNTFSNRTWHEVSRIQIRDINALELYSLDLLRYDLTVPHDSWTSFLCSLRVQHQRLGPGPVRNYPTPIGPVRDTPHIAILRLLDNLISAQSPPRKAGLLAQPIFLGIEERIRERCIQEQDRLSDADSADFFDLPLRDKYRRVQRHSFVVTPERHETAKTLPPPAAWSPAADPPLNVSRPRPQYVAVQRPVDFPRPTQQCCVAMPVGAPFLLLGCALATDRGPPGLGYNPAQTGNTSFDQPAVHLAYQTGHNMHIPPHAHSFPLHAFGRNGLPA